MVLVRRAIELAPYAGPLVHECKKLGEWTREILDGAMNVIVSTRPVS